MGESYAAGKGVARDLKQAAGWYRKAASKGDIGGEVHLAALYRDGGKGFPREMAQAAAWYRRAAEQGGAGAQGILGVLTTIGQSVPQGYAAAYYRRNQSALVKGPNQQRQRQSVVVTKPSPCRELA
jgi:TPR repeat protein